jgi:hypothetical protein
MVVYSRFAKDRCEYDRESAGTGDEIAVSERATEPPGLEPKWSADPYPIQDDLQQCCPIAHTSRLGEGWLLARYEEVAAIVYDTGHVSSRSITDDSPPPVGESR